MDTYQVLLIIDAHPEQAALVELPEGLIPLGVWSRIEIPIGSSHKFEVEIRRVK